MEDSWVKLLLSKKDISIKKNKLWQEDATFATRSRPSASRSRMPTESVIHPKNATLRANARVPEVRIRGTAPVIKREDTFEEASFPGGSTALTQYIKTNLQYPKECREGAPIGRVILGFTVNKDGSLGNIKVEKSLVPILDEEAIRVLKSMPKWTPAKKNGKVVKSHATIPFTFKVE